METAAELFGMFTKTRPHAHTKANVLWESMCYSRQHHKSLSNGGTPAEAHAPIEEGGAVTHTKAARADIWAIEESWAQTAVWLDPHALEAMCV